MDRFYETAAKRLSALSFAALALVAAPAIWAQDEPAETPEAESLLLDSGNEGEGIFHLNQSTADATNQDNIFAASSVSHSGTAVSDVTNSQQNTISQVAQPTGAVAMQNVANGTTGLVGINQSSSPGSSQGNLIAAALTDGHAGLALASAAATASGQPLVASLALIVPVNASMDGVGNGSAGVLQFNQLAGVSGAQTNVLSLAFSGDGIALADATAVSRASTAPDPDEDLPIAIAVGTSSLSNSFNAYSGIVQVNQATGAANTQVNLIAAAFGSYADASAISDTGLGNVRSVSGGDNAGGGQERFAGAVIEGSFDGFVGVAQVSQIAGVNNQTANTFAVSISTAPGN